jgi:hypothetical protein
MTNLSTSTEEARDEIILMDRRRSLHRSKVPNDLYIAVAIQIPRYVIQEPDLWSSGCPVLFLFGSGASASSQSSHERFVGQ